MVKMRSGGPNDLIEEVILRLAARRFLELSFSDMKIEGSSGSTELREAKGLEDEGGLGAEAGHLDC